jgi:hypothetical protein
VFLCPLSWAWVNRRIEAPERSAPRSPYGSRGRNRQKPSALASATTRPRTVPARRQDAQMAGGSLGCGYVYIGEQRELLSPLVEGERVNGHKVPPPERERHVVDKKRAKRNYNFFGIWNSRANHDPRPFEMRVSACRSGRNGFEIRGRELERRRVLGAQARLVGPSVEQPQCPDVAARRRGEIEPKVRTRNPVWPSLVWELYSRSHASCLSRADLEAGALTRT